MVRGFYLFSLCCCFVDALDELNTGESIQYDFSDIRVATNNFSDANKVGEGGYGAVYKVEMNICIGNSTMSL